MTRILVCNSQKDLPIEEAQIPPLVEAVLALEGVQVEEVSVLLAGVEEMCAIHAEHFDDPTPTDCMSFPMDEVILGDVVVCPKIAIEYVQEHGGDPYQELSLYLVHGLLHLLGYDDQDEESCVLMRLAEERHLNDLKERGCLLH
ncbi:MAG: rRNA maturation RNase YbeY [Verrucomicrobia bacterium]|nr:rRNA maturation RNase YbeY [Verrucomicrobiota bacterium]